MPSLRGLALPLQNSTRHYASGEEGPAGSDEIDRRDGLGEVSSMLDSIDDFSSGKDSADERSKHWQEQPQSPQAEDGAVATSSMNADQLRYYMKRHAGSSLSR
uniref:Uncharacterized protein n=1 Tax=Odontella aurita TaxID=265563 RepID=A0A7S4HS23_9STRA